MMKKYIAAIDLGTTQIRTLIGEKLPSGRFHILAQNEAPSSGIARSEVINILEVANVLKPLIKDLKLQLNDLLLQPEEAAELQPAVDFTEVYVGLAGQHIRCIKGSSGVMRNDPLAEISEQEINNLKKDMYRTRVEQGEQIIDIVPQDYCVDEHIAILNPVGMIGHRLEASFYLFVGSAFQIKHIQLSIGRVELKEHLLPGVVAPAEAVLHKEEKNMGVAVIDFGGGTTKVAVYYKGVLRHAAVIPFGGNEITEDIKKGCTIMLRQAESLKVQYGSCYSDLVKENTIVTISGIGGREAREVSFKILANIIEARMAEIMEAVLYEIEQSGYADRLDIGLVLTGGGAKLGHLLEFMRYKTGMEVRLGEPLFVTNDSPESVKDCSYATAIGLLLQGACVEENNIERIPVNIPVSVLVDVPVVEQSPVNVKEKEKEKTPKPAKKRRIDKIGEFMGDLFKVDSTV
jgi:cell division protein FtsA